jgi:hypothetical protein
MLAGRCVIGVTGGARLNAWFGAAPSFSPHGRPRGGAPTGGKTA